MKDIYVNYGCGFDAPDGWENYDASLTLRYERIPVIGRLYTKNEKRFPENVKYGDTVKGLPFKDNSVKGVYCSHILEHLSLEDCREALNNTYRMLQKDGLFRLVMPDLENAIDNYLKNKSYSASYEFMRETSLGIEKRNRTIKNFIFSWLGNSQHYWLWDYKSIKYELEQVGFQEVRKAQFGDSSDNKFSNVENSGRWANCLGVESMK